jgi:molecular chaperone GrpE
MTERDRDTEGEGERPRIRITDRRRVRPDGEGVSASAGVPADHEAGLPKVEPGDGPVVGLDEGVLSKAGELEAVRREADEYRDQLQRIAADFANYRKRVLKEQTRAVEMASEPVIRRLLEVLDEFDLALMSAESRPDFDKFLHGVELVYAKLADILRAEGLEPIEAMGKPFDPERHEALMQSEGGDGEPMVADVLRRGYTMKGRVIRPAGVRVTRK